ncbi:MAG: type II toxin-antitoxin system HigB family toxin [Rhizobacter sp.]|nr:type II toxin-antitoxin system HigB family toxin [Chlorobiales bacterium]
MVIIKKSTLIEYAKKYAGAKTALKEWYQNVKVADWSSLSDVKKHYPKTDFVGNDHYVFNIKGNAYRLVAMIHFSKRTLYIRFFGTHAEYDKIDATEI